MDYIVSTPCGKVQGVAGRRNGTAAYKGIRYATAGRWEYPTEVTHWEGVYDAGHYGHCCYQARSFYNEAERPDRNYYWREFRRGEQYTYSEDCQYLNIFTPDTAKEGDKLPVLIYIHGGSFTGGSGHEKYLDEPVWPACGIIGVTINYRVGVLGFCCLPQLKEEAGYTGNYGLFDQLTAILWVKHNIAAFGGDPDCITIMGQSAGAMSVQQHCLSPLSRGLFHRAVMCSGGGVCLPLASVEPEKHYPFWEARMKEAGCETLEQFRALPPEQLIGIWRNAQSEWHIPDSFPCIDGRLITGTGVALFKKRSQHIIPYMAGSTTEDMLPPILLRMARRWCAAQEKPSYTWIFDRQMPGDDRGAFHSADLWYWTGTLDNCWRPLEQKDHELSRQMVSYLCNFVRTGNPNHSGELPTWIASDRRQKRVLRLGEKPTRMTRPGLPRLVYNLLIRKNSDI